MDINKKIEKEEIVNLDDGFENTQERCDRHNKKTEELGRKSLAYWEQSVKEKQQEGKRNDVAGVLKHERNIDVERG